MFTVPVSPQTKVVVSNCLYFNGNWEYEFLFDPPYFVGIPSMFQSFGTQKNLTLMTATIDMPYYKDEELGLEILSLPYEHDSKREFVYTSLDSCLLQYGMKISQKLTCSS